MNRGNRYAAAIVATVAGLALSVIGCSLAPTDAEVAQADGSHLAAREVRVILLILDDNADGETFADEIGPFVAAHRAAREHRVIVRDSVRTTGTVQFVSAGTTRTLHVSTPLDPLSGRSLRTLLAELADAFPAPQEVLIVSGHGREWRGIGVRAENADASLTPESLAVAVGVATGDDVRRVVVLAASWTAIAELAVPLAGSGAFLVAAPGPVSAAGMDHTSLPEPSGTEIEDLAETYATGLSAAMVRAGAEEPRAVALSPTDLQRLPTAFRDLTAAAVGAIDSRAARDSVQEALVTAARVTATPGSMWSTLSDVSTAVGHPIQGPAGNLLAYLGDADLRGVPDGHRDDYRVDATISGLPEAFRDLQWAPDFVHRSGFLFRLWYHEF